jgi:hypothetical protein
MPPCDVCAAPATHDDRIVGAWLCEKTSCSDAAWRRAKDYVRGARTRLGICPNGLGHWEWVCCDDDDCKEN